MAELVWNGKHRPSLDEQSEARGQFQVQEHCAQESRGEPKGWHNRLIWGDKRAVLPALLREFSDAVDLVYIDPPFMTGRIFNSGNEVAYSDRWDNNLDSYLQWLYETFVLLHKLLAPNGSLYVHLDWRATHYAKLLLDELFGPGLNGEGAGFKNEIIWHYQSGGRAQSYYARKHDTLLLYTKSARYCFHGERVSERRGSQKRNHMRKEIAADGRVSWTIRSGGRLYSYDEDALMTPSDVWSDIHHLHQKDPERTGYATQKPAALLERVLLASSEVHDLVLDCFCGSGVTLTVAEHLGRRWIGCDQSELAITTTRSRLLAEEQTRPFIIQHMRSG